ncbi:MAG: PEGA domain protein [Berkelbacteria bacterium GW2011_GWA2_46_7]|uniref:PEGA domain protein n=1 Tax=Berkelbacteria bacterium GW2011_GWA2_46_7 TaxID=1618335 RepID=A0A0G1TC08_9BACT|nr:MAG: PEGA domain protein [Berkelbacteria bacterium GW2011_GWA2_46_7]
MTWTHDPVTNTYNRVLNGTAHKDRVSGEQIIAKTVVVMTVNHSANAPYAGTGKESEWTMTTVGSGATSVFEDGTRTDGTWKKPSRLERTRFYDGQGAEIPLNRGKIWIEVLPQDGSISTT